MGAALSVFVEVALIGCLNGLALVRSGVDWLLQFIRCDTSSLLHWVRSTHTLWPAQIPSVLRTDDAAFSSLGKFGYNFKTNYLNLDIGGLEQLRVHYVDHGPKTGKVLVLLHGEPSWSFLYRHMINQLSEQGYRCIAPDFLGFGKSDKPTKQSFYTHEMHIQTLEHIFNHLDLQNATLVMQDWGGLTGLSALPLLEARVAEIVVMNTGLPSAGPSLSLSAPRPPLRQKLQCILHFLLWRALVSFFQREVPLDVVFAPTEECPDRSYLQGYHAPFPTYAHKMGVASWPLLVPVLPTMRVAKHMRAAAEFLQQRWAKPALVMFSDNCPVSHGVEHQFFSLLPATEAGFVRIRGGGHFLQEERGGECAKHIAAFLRPK